MPRIVGVKYNPKKLEDLPWNDLNRRPLFTGNIPYIQKTMDVVLCIIHHVISCPSTHCHESGMSRDVKPENAFIATFPGNLPFLSSWSSWFSQKQVSPRRSFHLFPLKIWGDFTFWSTDAAEIRKGYWQWQGLTHTHSSSSKESPTFFCVT